MMLRLVLVGMVAALGVSIPSQPGCEHRFDSAQAWAISLLAEWDNWEPGDDNKPTLAGTQDRLGCAECRLARMGMAAMSSANSIDDRLASKGEASGSTPKTGPSIAGPNTASPRLKSSNTITFELIRVPDRFETGIAYELNRMAEGLVDTEVPSPDTVASSSISEPTLPIDANELGVWGGLVRVALDALAGEPPLETGLEAQSEPPAAGGSFICGFGYVDATGPAGPRAAAKPTDVHAGQTAKAGQVIQSVGFADSCLDEEWGLDMLPDDRKATPPVLTVLADLPRDVFAPESVTSTKAAIPGPAVIPAIGTLAYTPQTLVVSAPATVKKPPVILVDLPRDVFAPAPATLTRNPLVSKEPLAGTHSGPPRLGDAVELTRKAVSAWVSVLIGPALVDVSRR